jgi:putative transposase
VPKVFHQLYYHIVWTTRNREPILAEPIRPPLFAAIRAKCAELHCVVHALNAVDDHVHLALEIPPATAVSTVVGQVKGISSFTVNQRQPDSFYWQDGYGVVTFRKGELVKVRQYIETQEQRHRSGSLSPAFERCTTQEEPGPEA